MFLKNVYGALTYLLAKYSSTASSLNCALTRPLERIAFISDENTKLSPSL
jgi:hypothetical protein